MATCPPHPGHASALHASAAGSRNDEKHNDDAHRKCGRKSTPLIAFNVGLGLPLFFPHRPNARRRIKGSGSPAFDMRCCTSSILYGTRQNSTDLFSRSAIANPARASLSRG